MSDWKTIDYFFDQSLVEDPYPYFDSLRETCPVLHLPHLGVVAVTGYDEANDVYRNTESFSSCISVVGPFAQFPVPLEGDDITDVVAEHRHHLPMYEHMVTMDPPEHTQERSLLMRLITPKRLKDNEAFMWRLADMELDELVPHGRCEFIQAYAQPFAMLVVADLLGVPEDEHQRFREGFGLTKGIGKVGSKKSVGENPLAWLDEYFAAYIEDRRRAPRKDVLTDLALATYPDGSTPEVTKVVRTATFLFAAGQETTARLLAAALKHLAEHPDIQDELREHKDRIPNFIEEALRVESPVKTDFRLTTKSTTVGELDIAAGTPVMLLNGAANRDPRRFECPHDFKLDRPNAQAHLAFGRGVHSCPGGPLARAETRVSLERILDRMRNIRLSEEHHGPPGDRTFRYEPTWVLRGLTELHLEFDPIEDSAVSRVAVITGGASGIGLGVAQRLAADGRRVALLDLNGEGADQEAAALREQGHDAVGVACDVASRASVAAAFGRVRSELGPIEILVTSAGVESFTPLGDITDELWDRIIAVNLTGTFLCCQEAVADMLPAKWGRIVTIASSSAHSGAPRMVHYTASKGGVISMTRSLAVELGRSGITANAISPTVVDTPMAQEATARGDFPGVDKIVPMIPAGRAGTPEDIAVGCSYLCSDDAGYVTGQIICISGGMYI